LKASRQTIRASASFMVNLAGWRAKEEGITMTKRFHWGGWIADLFVKDLQSHRAPGQRRRLANARDR